MWLQFSLCFTVFSFLADGLILWLKILLAYDSYCDWIDSDCTLGHLGIKALFGPEGSLRLSESNAKINQKHNGKPNSCTKCSSWQEKLDQSGWIFMGRLVLIVTAGYQKTKIMRLFWFEQRQEGFPIIVCSLGGVSLYFLSQQEVTGRMQTDFFFSSLFSEDFYLCSNPSVYSEWCMKRLLCLNSSEAFIWSQWKPKHLSVSQLPRRWRQKGCAVIHVLKESGRKLWRSRDRERKRQMLWCLEH